MPLIPLSRDNYLAVQPGATVFPAGPGEQCAHPHQVVGRGGEEELPVHLLAATMLQFPQRPTVFILSETSSMRFRARWLTA